MVASPDQPVSFKLSSVIRTIGSHPVALTTPGTVRRADKDTRMSSITTIVVAVDVLTEVTLFGMQIKDTTSSLSPDFRLY
jgi:hypothetical protein